MSTYNLETLIGKKLKSTVAVIKYRATSGIYQKESIIAAGDVIGVLLGYRSVNDQNGRTFNFLNFRDSNGNIYYVRDYDINLDLDFIRGQGVLTDVEQTDANSLATKIMGYIQKAAIYGGLFYVIKRLIDKATEQGNKVIIDRGN